MSVTIVREYWKYPILAILRTIVVIGAFLATGVFLSNQNAQERPFPTEVPPFGTNNSLVFLPAACFEGDTSLRHTLGHSFDGVSPGSKIHGWNNYIAMVVWYAAAAIAETTRFVRRKKDGKGKRAAIARKFRRSCVFMTRHPTAVAWIFALYLIGGIGISAWTVGTSTVFILQMRLWAKQSGWMQLSDGGKSPEDDATTFGQLVPVFLTALTIFSFCQILSGMLSPILPPCCPSIMVC